MSKNYSHQLSLDQPAIYQIKVPGELDPSWLDQVVEITFKITNDEDGFPITQLTGEFDQAALQGLLRYLYSLGVPLVSVIWCEDK